MTRNARQFVCRLASLVAILGVTGCDAGSMTEPGGGGFAGTWIGEMRVVSCAPAGAACAAHQPGTTSYFDITFMNRQGDAVDGSIGLSKPGPLALPYGFPVKGRVSTGGAYAFERVELPTGEPRFSGELTMKTTKELTGRMTQDNTPSVTQPTTLVWDVSAERR